MTACSGLPKGVVGLATQVSKTGSMLECVFYNNGKEVAKIFYDEAGAPTKMEGKIPDGPVDVKVTGAPDGALSTPTGCRHYNQ
mgnify:CR=1 FL=1